MKDSREGGSRWLVPGIVLLLAFLSGIGFGLFMGSHFPSSSASENGASMNRSTDSPAVGAQTESQADAVLNSRIQELEKELSGQIKDQNALILNDRLAFFKKHHEGLDLEAFDGNLKLSPAMADVLGLTKEEQQAVEQHLAQIKNELDQYEDASTTLVKQSANSATFEVPANPGGEALQAKLNSLVSSDIGSDRAELFMSTISTFDYDTFDQGKKRTAIEWEDKNGGAASYITTESYFDSNGKMRGGSQYQYDGNSLPPTYVKLLQAVPGP